MGKCGSLELEVKVNTDGFLEKAQAVADARKALDKALDNLENHIITHTTTVKADQAAAGTMDIYCDGFFDTETQAMFEAVENAMGFKLFIWQKYFIVNGTFRRYGETTAVILRDLLEVGRQPLDYSIPPSSNRERIYREELRKIQRRLSASGIPTRHVFWNERDKRNFYTEAKENKA